MIKSIELDGLRRELVYCKKVDVIASLTLLVNLN